MWEDSTHRLDVGLLDAECRVLRSILQPFCVFVLVGLLLVVVRVVVFGFVVLVVAAAGVIAISCDQANARSHRWSCTPTRVCDSTTPFGAILFSVKSSLTYQREPTIAGI